MTENIQFLPLEIQTSVAELRALGVSDSVLGQLVDRILKAGEAKVTSLQLSIEQIEDNIRLRLDRLEGKLIADNQTRTSGIYEMVSEVRGAQQVAHPQIAAVQDTLEALDIPTNRARINAALAALNERVTRLEQLINPLGVA